MLTNRGLKKQDRPRDHNNDYSIQENTQTNKKNTEATRKCKKCDDVLLAHVATQGEGRGERVRKGREHLQQRPTLLDIRPEMSNVNKQETRAFLHDCVHVG